MEWMESLKNNESLQKCLPLLEKHSKVLSSVYAVLLVFIYGAVSYMELSVCHIQSRHLLETNGFYMYLYGISSIYLLYLICIVNVAKKTNNEITCCSKRFRVFDGTESHGKFPVRFIMVLFGLGTVGHFVLDPGLVRMFSDDIPDKCKDNTRKPQYIINIVLAILYTILQVIVVVMFPRLTIKCHRVLNSLGTKHIIATNMILWLGSLINESTEKIHDKTHKLEQNATTNGKINYTFCSEHHNMKMCDDPPSLKDYRDVRMYLYAFAIEFALMGALVFMGMTFQFDQPPAVSVASRKLSTRPRINSFIRTNDCKSSGVGLMLGILILATVIASLCVFHTGLTCPELDANATKIGMENCEKDWPQICPEINTHVYSTAVNLIGSMLIICGIISIHKHSNDSNLRKSVNHGTSFDFDKVLLCIGAGCSILFSLLTILTGTYGLNREYYSCKYPVAALLAFSGMIEMIQIISQILFLLVLRKRFFLYTEQSFKPGRQYVMFSFVFNLSQWIFLTAQVQKPSATTIQAVFFGYSPWVIIKRILLPLAIFYRFHSSVMSIELWKAAYQNARKIHKEPSVTEQIPQMGSKKVKDTLINSVFY